MDEKIVRQNFTTVRCRAAKNGTPKNTPLSMLFGHTTQLRISTRRTFSEFMCLGKSQLTIFLSNIFWSERTFAIKRPRACSFQTTWKFQIPRVQMALDTNLQHQDRSFRSSQCALQSRTSFRLRFMKMWCVRASNVERLTLFLERPMHLPRRSLKEQRHIREKTIH